MGDRANNNKHADHLLPELNRCQNPKNMIH
jgi:hypothetical protein